MCSKKIAENVLNCQNFISNRKSSSSSRSQRGP